MQIKNNSNKVEGQLLSSSEDSSAKYAQHVNKMRNLQQKVISSNFDISLLSHRRKGVKHSKRSEDMNILMHTVETDDSFEDEFCNLMDQTVTPLSSLFVDQDKMKIWNDFTNRSEEIQLRMLEDGLWDISDSDSEKDFGFEDFTNADNSCRLSPEKRFKKLDAGLRKFLRKRNFPKDTLKRLETEIIPFFEEDPNSVYVSHLDNCMHRLLLHALCQYLNLLSQSYDTAEGIRQTQVENQQQYFTVPDKTLSQYILKVKS